MTPEQTARAEGFKEEIRRWRFDGDARQVEVGEYVIYAEHISVVREAEHAAELRGWNKAIEAVLSALRKQKSLCVDTAVGTKDPTWFERAKEMRTAEWNIQRLLSPSSESVSVWKDIEDLPEVKFVRHIESHLDMGRQEVVCKICNKTLLEITSARGNAETEKGEGE